jgi:hypothetical protein
MNQKQLSVNRWLAVALSGVFLLFVLVDALLLRKNTSLQREIERKGSSAVLAKGTTIDMLPGIDLKGFSTTVSFRHDRRSTLLLVFSTECGICSVNWPRWNELVSNLDEKKYRVVYANTSNSLSQQYLNLHHVQKGEIIAKIDPDATVSYKFTMTPMAVLIDPSAIVQAVWVGSLKEDNFLRMKRQLGIQSTI